MAIKLNTNLSGDFEICQVCSDNNNSFDITDKSGIYSPTSNVGGWGGSNPSISDIIECKVKVIKPSGEIFEYNLKSPEFPNTNNSSKRVTVDFTFEDGVYEFIYILSGSSIGVDEILWEVKNTKYVLFYCQTQCCINKMLLDSSVFSCDHCKNKLDSVMLASMYLEGGKLAACCGNVSVASKLLNQAKFLCKKLECDGC